VVVQPNFRIFAFDPISDTVLARLDSFAIRRNAERAIEYELSRETLYRAQLAGQTAEQVQHWLEQATGAALPQNVARSLAEWQAAFERITVRSRVGWLEAAAPELVDVLLHDARWNKAIVKRATPTGLIVRADRIDELEQVLVAAGELPTRHKDPDADSRASIAPWKRTDASPCPTPRPACMFRAFCVFLRMEPRGLADHSAQRGRSQRGRFGRGNPPGAAASHGCEGDPRRAAGQDQGLEPALRRG
jgi:hypothetical protein